MKILPDWLKRTFTDYFEHSKTERKDKCYIFLQIASCGRATRTSAMRRVGTSRTIGAHPAIKPRLSAARAPYDDRSHRLPRSKPCTRSRREHWLALARQTLGKGCTAQIEKRPKLARFGRFGLLKEGPRYSEASPPPRPWTYVDTARSSASDRRSVQAGITP